uniref:Uncharacterized protein n=1 Tax=Arundo donax TaxID=35708 RepID=A0A0A9AWA7_ARUDO
MTSLIIKNDQPLVGMVLYLPC